MSSQAENNITAFLKKYVDMLSEFNLPQSDFPLKPRTQMAAGCAEIETQDGRHVATVRVEGDVTDLSMPLGPASMQYTQLFVELANGWMRFQQTKPEEKP